MSTVTRPTAVRHAEAIRAVPVRHPGRWVAAAGRCGRCLRWWSRAAVTNAQFQWDVVGQYFTASRCSTAWSARSS